MAIDPMFRNRGEFPTDKPMDALKTDHLLVEQLFDRYFAAKDMNEKKELGQHALLLLEVHTALEEQVFYPRVRDVDPSLIEHFEQDHEHAKQLIEQLHKLIDDENPSLEQMNSLFWQLADSILKHVEEEERQLFPKVEQANLDMTSIGQEMQAAEISLIAQRMQKPIAPGIRM